MVRRVAAGKGIRDDLSLVQFHPAVQDPVDVFQGFFPPEFMKGGGMGLVKDFGESLGSENGIGFSAGVCIKIPGDDHGATLWKIRQKIYDQLGAFFLHGFVKIKMGIDHDDPGGILFEKADDALPGPFAARQPGFDLGCVADKMMPVSQAGPGFVVKDQIALPPLPVGIVPADKIMIVQIFY